ncbi:uncharacterized protein LOC144556879 [Carex rostrata]
MATSDPNSSLPGWTDLYGHNQASASAAAAGINISSMTSMSMPDLTATSGSGSPPGRIGKSPRRRSRASRRAPVTLLNTDTSNFRAMVQQFTGIPSSSSSSGAYTGGISGSGGPTISFSAPNINTMRPSGGGGGGGGGVMSFGGGGQPQQYQYQYQSRQPPFQEQIYHSRQQQHDEYGAGENNNNNKNNNMFIDGAGAGAGAGGYHDHMHVINEGIFGDNNNTNHAAHSATNIHLRAHDHRYFG